LLILWGLSEYDPESFEPRFSRAKDDTHHQQQHCRDGMKAHPLEIDVTILEQLAIDCIGNSSELFKWSVVTASLAQRSGQSNAMSIPILNNTLKTKSSGQRHRTCAPPVVALII
jgi:hypothetical protein